MPTLTNGTSSLSELASLPANGAARTKGRLLDKVAVITGAGNGIGRQMARLFAAEGAHVVLADLDEAQARAAAAEIVDAGGQARALFVDIRDPECVRSMLANSLGWHDRLDILVNNAAVSLNQPFLDTSLDEWHTLVNVVLTGTFICSQAAARMMVAQRRGAIVNIASISGQRGAQGRAAYGSAKAGVIQLTRVMAVELAPYGVRVNAVSPGPVDTEMAGNHTRATRKSYLERIPLHRYGERHEVAAAALFLASDEASFVQGHVLNVDGGFFAAGLMFDPQAD